LPAAGPRVAFVYPNAYSVGMASLGYQAALQCMRRAGLAAERFFSYSAPVSWDSLAPAGRFDVLAFSIAFELDWLNILRFLRDAGIPLLARERGERDPIVLAGGVCVAMNRAPAWPFLDAFVHGEAEALAPALARALRAGERRRGAMLERLAGLAHVETTAHAAFDAESTESAALPDPPPWAWIESLDDAPCVSSVATPESEFGDMALLDLGRGCPNHCTFCWIGHNAPPYRPSSLERIERMADLALPLSDRLGLVSSAVGAHPEIDEICRRLLKRGARLSYSSLRIEETTATMLEALAQSGQKSLTIAPEAGSARLRRLLGKPFGDDAVLDIVDRALSLGMASFKLYFMTGLPTETEDESDEIARLVEKVRLRMVSAGKKSGAMGSISVNLGLFTPKPGTPLPRLANALDFAARARRLKRIERLLRRIPNTRIAASSPPLSGAQSILSLGGSETSRFLFDALDGSGGWRGAFQRWIRTRPDTRL